MKQKTRTIFTRKRIYILFAGPERLYKKYIYIIIIYVNDLLLLIYIITNINACKIILNKKFNIIDFGETRIIIGIRIIRDRIIKIKKLKIVRVGNAE